MAGLRRRLPGVALSLIDDFGVPEDAKEACLFAIIGFLSVHGLPSTIPSATGARHESVLGAIIHGRQAILTLPAEDAPTTAAFKVSVAT
jgi:anhydro-N-acetylmuramic acid kinase